MAELLSVVVTVRPQAPGTVPEHLGRAVYAQLLRWLADCDPTLARRWHDADGPKPFTCSTLVGGRRAGRNAQALDPETGCWFRLTSLDPEISAALARLVEQPPAVAELDGVLLDVEGLTTDPAAHPWAGATDYDTLAAPYLLARQEAARHIRLSFASPTSFRQNEMNMPVPLPDLVFGGLSDRWNAFSPVAISPEVRAYASACVAISSLRLRSRALPIKDGALQVGSVGEVRYVSVRYDRYWMAVLGLLADFAFYAGVGRMVSAGMGQARRAER